MGLSKRDMSQTKLESLVLHFANKVPLNLGRKKLAKLMYFVDFTNYELREKSISGITYQKYKFGPIPFDFSKILNNMESKGLIKCEPQIIEYSTAKIIPKEQPDYSVFDEEEKELIDAITEKYKLSTAAELEEKAKSEPPYKMVEFEEEIPYHLAFYRNTFEEMEMGNDQNTQ